ncbi:MAG: ATP-binding cassette domain-containing protein [Patulibacter minatonensis]
MRETLLAGDDNAGRGDQAARTVNSAPPPASTRALAVVHRHVAGDVAALRGVTLELRLDELTAVAGPSGAGKTTLLRALAGELHPTAGVALLGGRDAVSARRSHDAAAALLLRDDPARPPRSWARRAPRRTRLVEPASLSRLRLRSLIGRAPATMSSGERRRVDLLVALATTDAHVVLVDDPTRGLDHAAARTMVGELRAVARRGRCVVMTTTDPAVAGLADRTLTLAGGRVVADRMSSARTTEDRPIAARDGQ